METQSAEIRLGAPSKNLKFLSSSRSPVYLIQEFQGGTRRDIRLLLGGRLESTYFALDGNFGKKGRKIRIRSDAPHGVFMDGILKPDNPYDVFGHLCGCSSEIMRSQNGKFSCRMTNPSEDGIIVISDIAVNAATLLVSRRSLIDRGVAPELQCGPANPFFGEVVLIPHTFGQLADGVRATVNPGDYCILDS